jgi:hypothetical protein
MQPLLHDLEAGNAHHQQLLADGVTLLSRKSTFEDAAHRAEYSAEKRERHGLHIGK